MAASRDRSFTVSTTVLYLLVPLVVSVVVGSQISNFTEDLFGIFNQIVTSRPADNSKMSVWDNYKETERCTISNVTLSDDDLNKIEVDNNNRTVITEDDESFQDWENELQLGDCHEDLLIESSAFCGAEFYAKMSTVSKDNWCILDEIKRPYYQMTVCLEKLSNVVGCFYPNPIVQEFFLEVHSHFFQNCPSGVFVDPPESVVLTLTLIPVSLIPGLVYVVIWKNKTHQ